MSEVIIFRGVPGSGKSTVALLMMEYFPDHFVRVNRDDIRVLMFGTPRTEAFPEKEKAVTDVEHSLIKSALKSGKTPVVDATNLNKNSVKAIMRIAGAHGAVVRVADFPVPLEVAVERDSKRAGSLGADIIKKVFSKRGINQTTGALPALPEVPALDWDKFEPYNGHVEGLEDIVLVDIDGTIAHMTGRSPYDYHRVHEDIVDESVKNLVEILNDAGLKIVFFSGRKSMAKESSMLWLANNLEEDFDFELFTRDGDDNRPDYIVKYEMFNDHIRGKYNVRFVLDDRLQVVRMWHKLGVKVLRVGDPDSDF